MLDRAVGIHDDTITTNRTRFIAQLGLSYGDVVFQRITYSDTQTYDTIEDVTRDDTTRYKSEVAADALITAEPGVGLFLPVADCIATVIYDPRLNRVALLHLGRHSTIAGLMKKTLHHMEQGGSNPEDCIIWFGPSVQKESYRLEYFTHENDNDWQGFVTKKNDGIYIDMQGYNQAQAVAVGVNQDSIYHSAIDTAISDEYFSHSNGDTKGRFGIVAMLKR
jgi:copper oxidase (laccase) domain-containing protein